MVSNGKRGVVLIRQSVGPGKCCESIKSRVNTELSGNSLSGCHIDVSYAKKVEIQIVLIEWAISK